MPSSSEGVVEPAASNSPMAGSSDRLTDLEAVMPYRFKGASLLSSLEMRKFRDLHTEFALCLATRLSVHLRAEFGLKLLELETQSYEGFKKAVSPPAHLTVLRLDPLPEPCVVVLHPLMGFALVDRLMGGSGKIESTDVELNDIAIALLDQIVRIILADYCKQFSCGRSLHPVVVAHESDAKFLRRESEESMMLILNLEGHLGECVQALQIAIPFSMLEPLLHRIRGSGGSPADGQSEIRSTWLLQLQETPLALQASWNQLRMKARDVGCLKVGDIIPMDAQFANGVSLRIGSQARFLGRLGTIATKRALELTSTLPSKSTL